MLRHRPPRAAATLTRTASVCVLGVAALIASGCKPPPPAFVPPPPPVVTVAHAERRVIPDTLDFTGVIRAHDTVEVRARVRGFIQHKAFEGGSRVTAGALLYQIDPRPFEAAVQQADAARLSALASLQLAQTEFERISRLRADQTATETELNRATAERDVAEANVKLADARLAAARLDLEFTQVRSPINGRLGIDTVEVGDLVGATEPTLLATVADDSRVYARYSLDEQTVLRLRAQAAYRRPGEEGRADLEVRLGLLNETGYPRIGRFAHADIGIDPQTGTIMVESIFDNPDGAILPGSFARIQARFGEIEVLLVPEEAVLSDQGGRHVLVVNEQNVVERRAVTVGVQFEGQRAIQQGLTERDRIIVNGIQRARVGAPVSPELRSTTTAPARPTTRNS